MKARIARLGLGVALFFHCVAPGTANADGSKVKYKKCPKIIADKATGTYKTGKENYHCFSDASMAQRAGYLPAGTPGTPPTAPQPPVNSPFDIGGQGGSPSRGYNFSQATYSALLTAYLDPATCPANLEFTMDITLGDFQSRSMGMKLVPGTVISGQKRFEVSYGTFPSITVTPSTYHNPPYSNSLSRYPSCKWVVNVVPNY